MAKIIYIHGFRSTGDSEKAKQLKAAFPNHTVVAPNLSANPKQAIQQLHNIISSDIQSTIVVGTSLGGFYATYLACIYDVPAFIINPSLEPHISLKSKVGKYKRFGSDEDYDFETPYVDELKVLFDKLHASDKDANNLHFYLSTDDDVIKFDKLDTLFPNKRGVKTFDNAGHRFSRFPEIFPDIQNTLNQFKK
jgi:hypothetical protein